MTLEQEERAWKVIQELDKSLSVEKKADFLSRHYVEGEKAYNNDLTIVYYTANTIPRKFAKYVMKQLKEATGNLLLIRVDKDPKTPASHLGIYHQALEGARQARTKYIALCEDDVLYSPEHFKYRPSSGKFAYNMNFWNIMTWGQPMFTQKLGGRRNLSQLICERDLFIEAMEERFAKYPDGNVDLSKWAEPSKYERQLGVTVRDWETFTTNPPNIVFSHETSLSYQNLGKRKKSGEIRATEVPTWGKAERIQALYE